MLFQRKVDRAMDWIHQRSQSREENRQEASGGLPSMDELRREANEEMELEKGDFFAMLVSAFVIILPACLVALLIMVSVCLVFIF